MYHLRKLKSMLLLLLVAVSAQAQLTDGCVYRFVNVGKSDRSMAIGNLNKVVASTTVADDYAQLWYASSNGSGFTLRNLANGRYLYSPNATSGAWLTSKETTTSNSVFTATEIGSNYAIAVSGKSGYNYMHADGSNKIVCWESSNANSQWTITKVTNITDEELQTNWETLAAIDPSASTVLAYQTHLDNLFSDKACTVKKKDSFSESDPDYQALPEPLKQMVRKVYNDSWAEDNYDTNKSDWDAAYAMKYRVQLYEPYNEPEAAAKVLRFNAHTNMNNPTGIFANAKTPLYVMVEGKIKDGATLHLASYSGHSQLDGYNDGVELKQGLNIVPIFTDNANFCINYVVHNFDNSQGTGMPGVIEGRELSEYPDLKIHIEGGYINGYYNKVGDALYGSGDKNADWEYIEARATQTDVTVLGEYMVLQFPLLDKDTGGNKGLGSYFNDLVKIEDVINSWDNVMMWERLVMGLLSRETIEANAKKSPYSDKDYVFEYTGDDTDNYGSDYSDYYNIHGLAIAENSTYMSGGWKSSNYNCNTMDGVIRDLPTNAGSHWGPGHEIGHQHQQPLNLNGLTEVTNNLFSNVVLWYFGETTSRVNGDEGSLSHVLAAFNTEGSDFYTNNIWALTHMYYKLFLYYHVLGHNPKFYPRLFEMLRQDPMKNGGQIDGATSLLHFYKKCCLASGDDLTEFFRAYGFFRVMENRLVGDYSNGTYNMSQKDINEAIAEVKSWNYKENVAVLFINDATGETIKSHKGDNLELYGETTVCAEVGSYASFTDNTTPDYTYSVSGSTVTMEGTGGTGFAIFNEKGEIIAFSDKKTFEVSSECAVAIASGKAEVKTIKADNTVLEAVDVMDTDNAEAKYEALGELLTATADLLTYADADNSKPGFYRASVMETLQQLYDEAQSVYNNKEVASYATAYAALAQEYTRIAALDTDKTPFLPGSTYVLTNKKYPNVSMTLSNNALIASATNMSNSAQQWTFEATDEADIYYLKNGSNYMGSLSQSTQVGVTTKELASRYKLFDLGKGLWALQCQNDLEKLMSLHCNDSYKIVGWTHTATDNDGSWWYLTATVKDESMLPLYDLQNLVEKTEALVDEMATVQYKGGAIDMNACSITSNATETGHETKYLTDGNPSTFFHTVWSGSVVNDYHNIVIDLGEGHSLAEFVLSYTTLPTSAHNVDAPESLTVQGSNDGSSYTDIAALSNGLPTSKESEYTSSTLGSASQAYRYIRLQVKTATGNKLGSYYYFGLAELGLTRMTTIVESIGDKYANFITAEKVATVCDQVYAAQQTIALGSATSDDVAALQAQYDILLAAYENANNVEFNAKKAELFTLISNTNSLINSCGTITYTPATLDGALALQTTNSNGSWYVSSNADQNTGGGGSDGGGIAALVDNNYDTYFHTRWGGTAVSEPHHIQVDMGNGVEINDFVFSYKPRNGSPAPTSMIVYGSNDDNSFTEVLATISSGLPAHDSGITYTSSTIVSDKAYRYLRFTVTGSQGPGNNSYGGQCFFGMLEFDLTAVGRPESYTAELGAQPGEATSDLLLATYHAANDAQIVYDNAITENQVQDAINALQAQYDALFNAKYPNVEFSISVTGGNGNGGVLYKDVPYTTTLLAPEILTVGELAAIPLDGYEAKSVTLTNRVITVVYNKVYTVTITGGEGEGSVTFGGIEYFDGDEFDVEGDFTDDALIVTSVEGYVYDLGVDHITGEIIVNYTVDKSDWSSLVGEVETLINSCYTDGVLNYVNSDFINEDKMTEVRNAIVDAQTQCDNATTLGEYNEAKEALNQAKSTLEMAMASAEAEVIERNEKRTALNSKIDDANILIDQCIEQNLGDAITALIEDLRGAVELALAISEDTRSTQGAMQEAIDNLTTKCEALTDASSAVADLLEQIELIEETIAACGEIASAPATELSGTVTLQTTNPDAPFYLSTNAQEQSEGPIANLIDNNVGSFFHSSWNNIFGEAHYLQVDMGEQYALKEFAFSYTTRNNGTDGPHPSIIVVSGSNSADGEFVEMKTIESGLPTGGGERWSTAENIVAPQLPYRYLRFTVKQSAGDNKCKHSDDEYFFAMSEFNLTAVPAYYVESLNPNGSVTEEQLLEAFNAKMEAEELANTSSDLTALENMKAELDELHRELTDALNDLQLPVVLTTDMESPVLYTIKSKRGDTKVLQYDPAEGHMFSIADASRDNAKQLFYFTVGDTRTQVYVHPFAAGEQVLAADDTGDEAAKVFAREKGTASYDQWIFVEREQGYNLQPVGTSTYFSNYGGGGAKMGFYASYPNSDAGSLFSFTSASIEGSAAYHTLKVYLDEAVKDVSSNNPGYYRGTDAHVSAYEKAIEVLDNQSSDDADYLNAYNTLLSVNESLEMILPVEGKFYVIRSAHDGYAKDALVYANLDDNKMRWGSKELTDATAIWTIVPAGDGAYHICNLHTGTYINGVNETLNETAGNITLESLSVNGQFGFHSSGMMHAQSGGAIVKYTTSANGASAWRIEEVGHAAKIGQYLHTSLYLDYPTIIPEGVKAYIAKNPIAKNPSEEGTIDLVKLQGNVLPAKTGVILYSETPDTYNFLYTDAEATDDVKSENRLRGCASEQYVGDETGAKKYYIFGRSGDEVGLYRARMDYNADGENVGADKGTHFKASANKVYLELGASQPALSGFRFRVGGDETGIEGITIDADATIYDLYGRRVLEVVTPGLYIINGEKRYINIK